MDVGAAAGMAVVGGDGLNLCQLAFVVAEHHHFARQFGDEVGIAAFVVKRDVAWP